MDEVIGDVTRSSTRGPRRTRGAKTKERFGIGLPAADEIRSATTRRREHIGIDMNDMSELMISRNSRPSIYFRVPLRRCGSRPFACSRHRQHRIALCRRGHASACAHTVSLAQRDSHRRSAASVIANRHPKVEWRQAPRTGRATRPSAAPCCADRSNSTPTSTKRSSRSPSRRPSSSSSSGSRLAHYGKCASAASSMSGTTAWSWPQRLTRTTRAHCTGGRLVAHRRPLGEAAGLLDDAGMGPSPSPTTTRTFHGDANGAGGSRPSPPARMRLENTLRDRGEDQGRRGRRHPQGHDRREDRRVLLDGLIASPRGRTDPLRPPTDMRKEHRRRDETERARDCDGEQVAREEDRRHSGMCGPACTG